MSARIPLVLMPYTREPLSSLYGLFDHHIAVMRQNVSGSDYFYWELLRHYWGYPGDLLIVEHDMQVTDDDILALVECKEPLCSQAYKRSGDFYWCHNVTPTPYDPGGWGNQQSKWLDPPVGKRHSFAGFSGLGCCKITHRARYGKWLRATRFQKLDQAVTQALATPWHIHWPGVGHEHNLDGSPPDKATQEWYQKKLKERGLQVP